MFADYLLSARIPRGILVNRIAACVFALAMLAMAGVTQSYPPVWSSASHYA
jgi:hypothetical protein